MYEPKLRRNGFATIGYIRIDAGLCWIGDPCYVIAKDCEYGWEDWASFCQSLNQDKNTREQDPLLALETAVSFNYDRTIVQKESGLELHDAAPDRCGNTDINREGLGVCVGTGYGDGAYPVTARFNEEGRVVSVTVNFDITA
tara:strand:- start:265 stop:690 length:426 start_codon:yes stop_codon:yes gene_type:complete